MDILIVEFCVFIGDKRVTTNENPMPPVQRRYSIECTRGIGFPSVVTVSSPIKTQDYTHVLFSVHVEFVPQPTRNPSKIGQKKPYERQTNVTNQSILNHLKLDRAYSSLISFHR